LEKYLVISINGIMPLTHSLRSRLQATAVADREHLGAIHILTNIVIQSKYK